MAERWLAELIGICPMKESISSSSFVWIRFYYFFLYHFFLGLDWIGSNRLWFKIDSIIDDQNTSIKIGFMGKGELVEWNVNFRGSQCNNKKDIFTFEFSPPHTHFFSSIHFFHFSYISVRLGRQKKKNVSMASNSILIQPIHGRQRWQWRRRWQLLPSRKSEKRSRNRHQLQFYSIELKPTILYFWRQKRENEWEGRGEN